MDQLSWALLLLVLIGLVIFLPKIGLRDYLRRRNAAVEREHKEDALKLLLDRKWANRSASSSTLKASLGLNDSQTLSLINRMADQGLVTATGSDLVLTPSGERIAIQITRAHRLIERYLADEARMPLEKVHSEAHRREHHYSQDQLDDLDASLGFPASDPHGDPIPDRRGTLHQVETRPLTNWNLDEIGRVAHIEDEPAIAYAQVQAEGIFLGQTLRLVESTPGRLIVTDGESEYRLAPAVAANVHLETVAALTPHNNVIPLHHLIDQQEAEIISIADTCQGFTRRRFLDLGLTPGTTIFPELPNAFGDPRAYRVRGTLIALRKDQADQIWVRPTDTPRTFNRNPQPLEG